MLNPIKYGKLYVFEGADGTGKSAIVEYLGNSLKRSNNPTKIFSFPGKTPGTLGKVVYDIHHHPEKYQINSINQASLQLLHIAAHLELIEMEIIPALKSGITVLLDRFWWSTYVYGKINGISTELLNTMIQVEKIGWKEFLPTAIFYIFRTTPFIQEYPINFWHQVCNEYEKIINTENQNNRIHKLKNTSTLKDIVNKIQELF